MTEKFAPIVRRLGGPTIILAALGLDVSRQAVSNWQKNGIPHKYRLKVADLMKARGYKVPKWFFE